MPGSWALISALALAHGFCRSEAQTLVRPDLTWMAPGIAEDPYSMTFSADGKLLLVGTGGSGVADLNAKVFRVSDGGQLRTFVHNGYVYAGAFSPKSDLVATGSSDGLVHVWRMDDGGEVFAQPGHAGGVYCVAFSSDGKWVASSGRDKTVKIWSAIDGTLRRTLAGHTSTVTAVAFSPDGTMLASAAGNVANIADYSVRLWNLADYSQVRQLEAPPLDTSTGYLLSFSANGLLLRLGVKGYRSGAGVSAIVWRISDGSVVGSAPISTKPLHAVGFLPDGDTVIGLSGGLYGNFGAAGTVAEVRRLSTGQLLRTFADPRDGVAIAGAFSPNGSVLAIGGQGFVALWDVGTGAYLRKLTHVGEGGPQILTGSTTSGMFASCAGNHGTPVVRRASDGSVIRSFVAAPGGLPDLGLSPDGRYLAEVRWESGSKLWLWDVTTGARVKTIPVNGGSRGAQFSPDGRFLVVYDTVYRFSDMSPVATIYPGGNIQFSRDGTSLAVGIDTVYLYRTSDWALSRTFVPAAFTRGTASALSPEGKLLAKAVGSDGFGYIDVWNTADGNRRLTIPLPDVLQILAFTPDGEFLVGRTKSTAELYFWRVTDGAPYLRMREEVGSPVRGGGYVEDQQGILGMEFTPDGRTLILARGDGTIAALLNPVRNVVLPDHGGNSGYVTVRVITALDFPLTDGATVTLKGAGFAPIAPVSTKRESDYVLTATFDLRGAPLGKRDVVVSSPGVGERTYAQAFAVEQGTAAQLVPHILGRSLQRAGQFAVKTVLFSNEGNTDSVPGLWWLSVPTNVSWDVPDPLSIVDSIGVFDNAMMLMHMPGSVPAGGTIASSIAINVSDIPSNGHLPYTIEAWTHKWYVPSIRKSISQGSPFGIQDSDKLSADTVARLAKQAGFSCEDLTTAVAIAGWESNGFHLVYPRFFGPPGELVSIG